MEVSRQNGGDRKQKVCMCLKNCFAESKKNLRRCDHAITFSNSFILIPYS